ncbi:MAG: response regulator transcription factor [Flavobacteriales bacterium]
MSKAKATDEPLADIRVALADDHWAVRNSWRQLFEAKPGFRVVLEVSNGQEFIDGLPAALPVHLAVVDACMPGVDGYEAIRVTKEKHPEVKMLAVSFDGSDENVLKLIHLGACGFLGKDAMPNDYHRATDHIVSTGYYHTDRVHQLLLQHPGGLTAEQRALQQAYADITAREMEIMALLAREDEPSTEKAADELNLSKRTVESHVKNVCEKLEKKTRLGALLLLIRSKLLK